MRSGPAPAPPAPFLVVLLMLVLATAFTFNVVFFANVSERPACAAFERGAGGLSLASAALASAIRRVRPRRAAAPTAAVNAGADAAPRALPALPKAIVLLAQLDRILRARGAPLADARHVDAARRLIAVLDAAQLLADGPAAATKGVATDTSAEAEERAARGRYFHGPVMKAVRHFAESVVRSSDGSYVAGRPHGSAPAVDASFAVPQLPLGADAKASPSSSLLTKRASAAPMSAAAHAAVAAAVAAIAPDLPSEPGPPLDAAARLRTQQHCYFQTDESELCTYEGVLCFDGVSPVVVVDAPMQAEAGGTFQKPAPDDAMRCMDRRYSEPSSPEFGCGTEAGALDRMGQDLSLLSSSLLKFRQPAGDTSLPLDNRRWGPANRNGGLLFREVTPAAVFGLQPERIISRFQGRGDAVEPIGEGTGAETTILWEKGGEAVEEAVPLPSGLRPLLQTRAGPDGALIDWVDASLYLTGLEAGASSSSMQWWASAAAAFFDAQRHNVSGGFGSHPSDGLIHFLDPWKIAVKASIGTDPNHLPGDDTPEEGAAPLPPTRSKTQWRQGRQWRMPPMDAVLFAGDGAREVADTSALDDWFRATLRLSVQAQTQHFFADLLRLLAPPATEGGGGGGGRMVCSLRPSAVLGAKPKMFTGRADGWMLRQYGYQAAKLPLCIGKPKFLVDAVTGNKLPCVRPHPLYPPRNVTVVDDDDLVGVFGRRAFWNRDELVQSVDRVGLPHSLALGLLQRPFAEQLRVLSGTGILVAPHGHPALANIMFLPSHASVVEVFPLHASGRDTRHMAEMLDLHYFAVFSEREPEVDTATEAVEGPLATRKQAFWDQCLALNASTSDNLLVAACDAAARSVPAVVQFNRFEAAMRDAVDSIGAFSLLNAEWKLLAPTQGRPVPESPIDRQKHVDKYGING